MGDWLIEQTLGRLASYWATHVVPWLMVYTVAIIGAVVMVCFLLQMLTGNIKWAKRAGILLALGCVAMGFVYG